MAARMPLLPDSRTASAATGVPQDARGPRKTGLAGNAALPCGDTLVEVAMRPRDLRDVKLFQLQRANRPNRNQLPDVDRGFGAFEWRA
jgi:hypothetical protein